MSLIWRTEMTVNERQQADLAIIIVSTNEAHWLHLCLRSIFARSGDITLDVVVVDNDSSDGARELVESSFPGARVVWCENRGFGHANNHGAMTCNARYVLFLNPDTEIVEGTFDELVALLDAGGDIGLAGVRQVTGNGTLWPTIRYFPSVTRSLGEAFGSERWPRRWRWAGERELDMSLYSRELDCDWTSGSFMLARREALLSAGLMDERFFIYCEEPDLCLRMKRAGWRVRHLPQMTIIHHAGKGGVRPKMIAQAAFTRRQYADKHFDSTYRAAFLTAESVRHLVRSAAPGVAGGSTGRQAARSAFRTLAGLDGPPFGEPPATGITSSQTA
jgi:N-acetylglucosaminyl-diphospho-decaprenol L-rhamnosyltransferase